MAYSPIIENHPLEVIRYHNRGPAGIKIIVVHIQDGRNFGSWDWWHNVAASSTVMIARTGVIWRIIPEHLAPWTNGDVKNPTPEMTKVLNTWGWDPNTYTLSIELEGYSYAANPMGWPVGFTPEQQEAMEWQIQTWQDEYDIPDDMVFRHGHINSVTRPNCIPLPMWAVVSNFVAASPASTPPVTPSPYAQPFRIPNFDGSKDVVINNVTFFADRRVATISASLANFRIFAVRNSAITRAPQDRGTSFEVIGWVEGEEVLGERRWWIADDHSRVWVGATYEKPRTDPIGQPDYVPRGPVIYDGQVYYRMSDFNEFWPDGKKVTVTASKANLREDATTSSSVVGVVKRGTELNAKYFTVGEEVRDENLWYVLHDRRGSIKHGARIWCAATSLRPR